MASRVAVEGYGETCGTKSLGAPKRCGTKKWVPHALRFL